MTAPKYFLRREASDGTVGSDRDTWRRGGSPARTVAVLAHSTREADELIREGVWAIESDDCRGIIVKHAAVHPGTQQVSGTAQHCSDPACPVEIHWDDIPTRGRGRHVTAGQMVMAQRIHAHRTSGKRLELPVVTVEPNVPGFVVVGVACPLCLGVHHHGVPDAPLGDEQRSPHCRLARHHFPGGYWLTDPDNLLTTWKEPQR